MFIKKLIFPKDNESIKNPMFNNLPSLDFCYSKGNNAKEIAKFVILIGKNGSGKTSLLILIRKLIECYEMCQKNTLSLKKHDRDHFTCDHSTIDLSLIDREINFLFEKPSNDYYLELKNMDIFNPDKELFCKVFCDNNKNNISINCISLPTSFSIDKNKNEDYCSEIYEEDKKRNDYLEYTIKLINCYNISLAKQIQNESKNINVRERYDQLFSKFGIKTFGDSIKKGIYFNINKKFNRTINQLPSGFRQLFNLWKAMLENNDTIFLIDEPENSLYPLEQEKISSFFTREFEKNIKTQFFIATHSPFIIKNFLNCNDAVIINVETGENILKSEEKKLLLNKNNNVSYDEISYLYYDIPTSNYYISLYEIMFWKFDECSEKKSKSKNKKEEDFYDFLLEKINLESLENKIYKVGCILSSDKLNKMKKEKNKKITTDELDFLDNLTLLRNMLAHNDGSQNWNVEIFEDEKNSQIFEKYEESKNFYLPFKENFEKLLKEQIGTIRTILINWDEIIKALPKIK